MKPPQRNIILEFYISPVEKLGKKYCNFLSKSLVNVE
jgi:hypothetical protein